MIPIRFRPIDEELNDLHTPLSVTLSEDDDENDFALRGYNVNTSGSGMVTGNPTKPLFLQESNARASTLRTWSSTEQFSQQKSQSYQDLHDQQRIHPFSKHLLYHQRQPREHVAHRQRSPHTMLMPEGKHGYYPTTRPRCPYSHQNYNHKATYTTPTSARSSHCLHETFINKWG